MTIIYGTCATTIIVVEPIKSQYPVKISICDVNSVVYTMNNTITMVTEFVVGKQLILSERDSEIHPP